MARFNTLWEMEPFHCASRRTVQIVSIPYGKWNRSDGRKRVVFTDRVSIPYGKWNLREKEVTIFNVEFQYPMGNGTKIAPIGQKGGA